MGQMGRVMESAGMGMSGCGCGVVKAMWLGCGRAYGTVGQDRVGKDLRHRMR